MTVKIVKKWYFFVVLKILETQLNKIWKIKYVIIVVIF